MTGESNIDLELKNPTFHMHVIFFVLHSFDRTLQLYYGRLMSAMTFSNTSALAKFFDLCRGTKRGASSFDDEYEGERCVLFTFVV